MTTHSNTGDWWWGGVISNQTTAACSGVGGGDIYVQPLVHSLLLPYSRLAVKTEFLRVEIAKKEQGHS